jgi:hypothetical protein
MKDRALGVGRESSSGLLTGFLPANGSWPEHPGLKSETWASHSTFVRAIFIFLGGPKVGYRIVIPTGAKPPRGGYS